MPSGGAAPRPGEVFELAEQDYRYGVGPVIARIEQVLGPVTYRGEPWWRVSATVANGTPERHGGWQERELYLRESGLGNTRRTPRA